MIPCPSQKSKYGKLKMSSFKVVPTATDGPCRADSIDNLEIPNVQDHFEPNRNGDTIVLGIEGSANKCGVGILKYSPPSTSETCGTYTILANPRKVSSDVFMNTNYEGIS